MDDNAPDFESHNPIYSNQLSIDSIVNIYKNGGWGSYKKKVFEDLKGNIEVTRNVAWKNLSFDW